MQKKKKWLILGGAGLALAALAVFLGLKYLPLHRLLKRPSSADIAFVNNLQGPDSGPYSLYFDFEVDSTRKIPSGIYEGIAHSGRFSAKTFGKNSFSVSMEKTVGDLNIPDMKAVGLSAWVYVFPTGKDPVGSLVFTVTNRVGVNTCWKGVSLHGPYVPLEKWFKISGSFDLSDVQIRPDDKIQIYFWNNSNTKILSDDFYVVFGAQSPRRGDSAIVDMTRSSFQPRFNLPPFPDLLLQSAEAGNGSITFGELTPNHRMVAGRFLPAGGGLESLFSVAPDGTAEFCLYCPGNGFRMVPAAYPSDWQKTMASARLIAGSFTAEGSDQLLLADETGLLLASVGRPEDPCRTGGSVALQLLWRSDGPEIGGIPVRNPESIVPCDLNGDKVTELLVVGENGLWELLRFAKEGWVSIATGKENKIGEWDDKYSDFTITAGRFVKGSKQDQLLTVFSEKSKARYVYSLVGFSVGEKKFVKALSGREGTTGITVGHDTLKPTDLFFFGRFGGSEEGFLRYNRDWRYDLKKMTFNDSTFAILGNIDFSGYDGDRNPKYYEVLKLVPGRFTDPSFTSLLVVAGNVKDKNYKGGEPREWEEVPGLPNTVGFYSYQTKRKP